MANTVYLGTITAEDIYGVGSLDTVSDQTTKGKTNPTEGAGLSPTGHGNSIFSLSGNILGQPVIVWGGMVLLLIVMKYVIEQPMIKKTLGG